MRRPEQHWRLLACIGVWLCLVLASGGVRAMVPPLSNGQAARLVSVVPPESTSTPQMLDSVPCAHCHAAPLPVDQGSNEKPGGPNDPVHRVNGAMFPPLPDSAAFAARPPRLCARIAFCRWLD